MSPKPEPDTDQDPEPEPALALEAADITVVRGLGLVEEAGVAVLSLCWRLMVWAAHRAQRVPSVYLLPICPSPQWRGPTGYRCLAKCQCQISEKKAQERGGDYERVSQWQSHSLQWCRWVGPCLVYRSPCKCAGLTVKNQSTRAWPRSSKADGR